MAQNHESQPQIDKQESFANKAWRIAKVAGAVVLSALAVDVGLDLLDGK